MTEPKTLEEWKEHLSQFDPWNERVLFAYLSTFGKPPSMLDIGCGTGAMVKAARQLGIDAIGVDQIENKKPDIVHDLTKPINLGRTFGLVTCIEVAEHIPQKKMGIFLNNMASHVTRSSADDENPRRGMLVFTAAHPGQGGDAHVNLKPSHQWRNLLHDRGLSYRDDLSCRLRIAWQNIGMPMYWLVSNLQVFEH